MLNYFSKILLGISLLLSTALRAEVVHNDHKSCANEKGKLHLEASYTSPTSISNWSSWTLATGDTLNVNLNAISSTGSNEFIFKITNAPAGFAVVENTGRLSFRPLSNQIGTYAIDLEVTDEDQVVSTFQTTVTVTNGSTSDPVGYIVDLKAPFSGQANGTASNPFNSIKAAVDYAVNNGGGAVLIRGGNYELETSVRIDAVASANNPVIIRPLDGEHVKINFDFRSAFDFKPNARHIVLEGIEIDGNTDRINFWDIVGRAFWNDESIPRGGGLAVILDGHYIKVRGNYIHDCYQKAIEIRDARYVEVKGNIIHNIGTSSTSGGHGIMRQQKGIEFTDNDIPELYRWDINGNFIFGVEQRIYSWVPSKGYIEMVLDEGKSILIDDPKDTDGVQEEMKARIINNVVAYGSIDHIRLKSTPNLEVSHNSIYSDSPYGDGITDKQGDTTTPTFINFKARYNAVQTPSTSFAIELGQVVIEAGYLPTTNNFHYNIGAQGKVRPTGFNGLISHSTTQLFVDAPNGNFRINPALGLSDSLGVYTSVLDAMDSMLVTFGVDFKKEDWLIDHKLLSQTILDNIPGINDGIAGNDTVFTGPGSFISGKDSLVFNVVNGTWKTKTGSPSQQSFRLNHTYREWYEATDAMYKNSSGNDYERLRWGNSYLKQNQVFDPDWLLVSQITSDTNTVIRGEEYAITLDGDILIDFEGITPTIGDYYDLIVGQSIVGASSEELFDSVRFEGYTPDFYTLTVVNTPTGQALRLEITGAPCNSIVTSTADDGAGTLRNAIGCATNGATITLDISLQNDTIKLTSSILVFDKDLTINAAVKNIFVQNLSSSSEIEVAENKTVSFSNFHILSDRFINRGRLNLANMTFRSKIGTTQPVFISEIGSVLNMLPTSEVVE